MPHKSIGLTLIELLIASTLGLVVIAAVLSLFISSRMSFNETEKFIAMNENARYAMSVINDELKLVSFFGDAHSTSITIDADMSPIVSDCSNLAKGFDMNNSLWVITATSNNVANCITDAAEGSDVIFIKHAAPTKTALANLASDTNYLMTNAMTGVLFSGGDTASPPTNIIGGDVPNGNVWEYLATAYYVREETGKPPRLYRKRLKDNAWESPGEEVAAGIERIRLQFGVDNNNDAIADFFVSSADVVNWNIVVSIHLSLLIRSENSDAHYTDDKDYQFGDAAYGGETYTPNDNYRRILVNTSITPRTRRLHLKGGF